MSDSKSEPEIQIPIAPVHLAAPAHHDPASEYEDNLPLKRMKSNGPVWLNRDMLGFVDPDPNEPSQSNEGHPIPWYIRLPNSPFSKLFDLTVFLSYLVVFFIIPLRLAFRPNSWDGADIFFDTLFVFDVLLAFVSAYYEGETLITDTVMIRRRYLKSRFWMDLVTCFPYYYFAGALIKTRPSLDVFRILELSKLARTWRFNRLLQRFEDASHIHPASLRGIKLVIAVFAFGHVCACFWIYVALDQTESWMTATGMTEATQQEQYLAAFYWFWITFGTIGYGDIVPRNAGERAFVIVVIIISIVAMSYATATLTSVVNSYDKALLIYREKVEELALFMDRTNLSESLRTRLKKHYRYQFGNYNNNHTESVLETVPMHLRAEVAMSVFADVLRGCAIFKAFNDPAFVHALVVHLRSRQYDAKEVIASQSEVTRDWILIKSGVVEAFFMGRSLGCFLANFTLGEVGLLLTKRWEFTLRCRTPVEVVVVSKKALQGVLGEFPRCYEILKGVAQAKRAIFAQSKEEIIREISGNTPKIGVFTAHPHLSGLKAFPFVPTNPSAPGGPEMEMALISPIAGSQPSPSQDSGSDSDSDQDSDSESISTISFPISSKSPSPPAASPASPASPAPPASASPASPASASPASPASPSASSSLLSPIPALIPAPPSPSRSRTPANSAI